MIETLMILKRNGVAVAFDAAKITAAVKKAFLFDEHGNARAGSNTDTVRQQIDRIGEAAAAAVLAKARREGVISVRIEDVQDRVELELMRSGEHAVARDYVLFRQKRASERAAHQNSMAPVPLRYTNEAGVLMQLDRAAFMGSVLPLCTAHGHPEYADVIINAALRDCFDGVSEANVRRALVLNARSQIERDPVFNKITAGLTLIDLKGEVFQGREISDAEYFGEQIKTGIAIGIYSAQLAHFDLEKLAGAIRADRDALFGFLGLQTLYDRYLVIDKTGKEARRIETPQGFLMRVAMGLAINEIHRDEKAIEFYEVLSKLDFMSSTPTLFNAGTARPQLSSCYLTTVSDDLDGIYEAIKENALLQKYAGGLGNDWTPVRAMGSHIKGTNGESQGTIPFLKVVNDTAVAVNQGGKRKGAVCAYLETWHLDIDEFLALRKNTGDDRRRTHDMNTAHWIPDLFMKRVMEKGAWTLFSPSDVPDLHDLYGEAFEAAYIAYEARAAAGSIKLHKTVQAVDLWRDMLTMLFETGHPWLTFKDPINLRSPQQHVGVVHSSNLCTEITLNTSDTEIAVCNLGSVNLVNHLVLGASGAYEIDRDKLRKTVKTAMRMLDNVIDINLYTVKKARTSNLKHRPVGLGIMGFQDALHLMRTPYASKEAVQFASESMEAVCFNAYWASSELAEERGRYSSYKGSLWDRGVFPQDSVALVTRARGEKYHLPVEITPRCDWDALRNRVKIHGMRNSNCVAIAPTATIANIVDVSASIEPNYQNLFVKSNMSGEFTVINEYLVHDLKKLALWDDEMIADLKYNDGALGKIDRIPATLKAIYATAFDNDPKWYVEAASARQRWIDQGQSLNVYVSGVSGKKLDELYKFAWLKGLKTTYYLRTMAATSAEKSTGNGGELNAVSANPMTVASQLPDVAVPRAQSAPDLTNSTAAFCSLDDVLNGACESCQ